MTMLCLFALIGQSPITGRAMLPGDWAVTRNKGNDIVLRDTRFAFGYSQPSFAYGYGSYPDVKVEVGTLVQILDKQTHGNGYAYTFKVGTQTVTMSDQFLLAIDLASARLIYRDLATSLAKIKAKPGKSRADRKAYAIASGKMRRTLCHRHNVSPSDLALIESIGAKAQW